MNTMIIEKKGKFDTDYDRILWTLKVRSKDETRQAITGVNIDGGLMVCTDGHRMHCYMTDRNIDNGYYHVKQSTAKMIVLEKDQDGIDYPEYQRVFPSHKPTKRLFCNGDKSPFIRTIYHDFADNCGYNVEFLHDAYMENSDIEISHTGNMAPLCLYDVSNNRAALIMPTKM